MESKFYTTARASVFVFVAFLLVVVFAPSSFAAGFDPMSESMLVLPANSGITTRWIVPPANLEKPIPKHTLNEIQFSIDSQGSPWIGLNGRQLLNPVKQVAASLSEPYQRFVHMDSGMMMFSTVRMLGFMGIAANPELDAQGYPIIPFQPMFDLPSYYTRIYRAAGNCVYLVSEDIRTQKTILFVLHPETDSAGKITGPGGYQKIFESAEPITSVAGNGTMTFMAMGKLIVLLDQTSNVLRVPVQQDEEVKELAFSQGVGLFYATASGVGFVGEKRAFKFLETSNPRIAVKGQSLYVLFPRHLGVMAFDNIDKLWSFDFDLSALN